jgi:hypothetical protein
MRRCGLNARMVGPAEDWYICLSSTGCADTRKLLGQDPLLESPEKLAVLTRNFFFGA